MLFRCLLIIVKILFLFIFLFTSSYRCDSGEFYGYFGVEHRNIPWTVPMMAAISSNGTVLLRRLHNRLDSNQFIDFLRRLTVQLELQGLVPPYPVAYDCNPVQRSRAVEAFRSSQSSLQLQLWARSSPDFMPLGGVFQTVINSLNASLGGGRRLRDEDEMWREFNAAWQSLSVDDVRDSIMRSEAILNSIHRMNGVNQLH